MREGNDNFSRKYMAIGSGPFCSSVKMKIDIRSAAACQIDEIIIIMRNKHIIIAGHTLGRLDIRKAINRNFAAGAARERNSFAQSTADPITNE